MNRQDGKRQLRRLREQRGWSWTDEARAIKDMARRLGIDRLAQTEIASIKRTIARWESETAKATAPDERYQWMLAHLFAGRDGQMGSSTSGQARNSCAYSRHSHQWECHQTALPSCKTPLFHG